MQLLLPAWSCKAGVLSIEAASCAAVEAVSIDVDEDACMAAEENVLAASRTGV